MSAVSQCGLLVGTNSVGNLPTRVNHLPYFSKNPDDCVNVLHKTNHFLETLYNFDVGIKSPEKAV